MLTPPGSARGDARCGLTLVELMLAVVVAGVVLAAVTRIGVTQQRTFLALANDAALTTQIRDASTLLSADLRGLSARAGDVREATDTSVELRETIGSAVVCDTLSASLVMAPVARGATAFAAVVVPVQPADTAWFLGAADTAAVWRPFRISTVGSTPGGQCARVGPRLPASATSLPRVTIALDSSPAARAALGRVLRFTRPIRYSVYRASDGRWYLGARDWNAASVRFNTIQPVAGPFDAPSAATPVFQWFDSSGSRLATPVARPSDIAFATVTLRGRTRVADRVLGSARDTGQRRDSAVIMAAIRNRR